MNLEHFPNFIRANYPMIANESNDTLIEFGEEFKKYLEEKFVNAKEKLEPIWDIDPKTVIMAQVNNDPFKMNGYHPALFIHLNEFVQKSIKETQN